MSAAEWLTDSAKGIAKTVRPAQVRMATIVEEVLADKGFAMIEAGTGTGKSFAYLIPAILSGKRVVISTAKKALQKQLRDNDLPFLLKQLGSATTFGSLKGKNNYVCQLRLEDFAKGDAVGRYSRADFEAFQAWAEHDEFGEIDDYPFDVDFAGHVRVSECVSKHCDYAADCGYRKAKNKAGVANIVIVNHALLAFDLAMGGGKIVGKYDAVIIDEAHQAAKYFREAHTCRIHLKQPEALHKLLQDSGLRVPETLEGRVVDFLNRLPERGLVRQNNAAIETAMAVYRDLGQVKQQLIAEGAWSTAPGEGDDDDNSLRDAKELSRLRAAATVTQRMLKACEVCVDKLDVKLDDDGAEVLTAQDYVMYVETKMMRGEPQKEFVATPIEIGPLVLPALKKIGTAVFTSATLSTGGTFDYMCREFGFRPDEIKVKEAVPLAFDYKRNACLYVSGTTVEYKREVRQEYWDTCAAEMHDLLVASKGGAFVLCSSYEDMTAFFDRLAAKKNANYVMRSQTGNVDALIDWFRATPNSVILGVKSIWEGVDIPGRALRLVVIPRLPFPNPDDPVFTARKAKYIAARMRAGAEQKAADIGAWQHYDLQEAIMDFKQGAGRLIRRETDMGVVAVLDRRLFANTKRYGGTVRGSIPHPPTYDLNATKGLLQALSK